VKVLVVGLYPPPGSSPATRTMHVARHLEADGGHDVEVYSRLCTAAHHRGPLDGPAGAWSVLRRSRRFDAVVVTGDGLLRSSPKWGPTVARLMLLVDCLAWGLAFRFMRRPEVAVGNADVLPSGVGGRATEFMWKPVERAVFPTEPLHVRRAVETPAGAAVDAPEPLGLATAPKWDEGWNGASDAATVEELIQRRAAAARHAHTAGAHLP
jgi:hypothetical protein